MWITQATASGSSRGRSQLASGAPGRLDLGRGRARPAPGSSASSRACRSRAPARAGSSGAATAPSRISACAGSRRARSTAAARSATRAPGRRAERSDRRRGGARLTRPPELRVTGRRARRLSASAGLSLPLSTRRVHEEVHGNQLEQAASYTDIRYETGDGRGRRGSRRSRSTGPRCATPSGRRRCSSCRTPSSARATITEVGVIVLTGEGDRGLLLRRRPADPRRRRLHRRRRGRQARDRPAQRARPPGPDPPPAEAGRRDGRRLRDRRRPRAARRVRPHDRGRQRALRPDRAEGRQLRRRLRRRLPGTDRRPQEGDARSGSCAASTTPQQALEMGLVNTVVPLDRLEEETVQWCREMLELSPIALRMLKGALQRRHRRAGRPPAVRRRRDDALLHDRGGPGGPRRLRARSAGPTSPSSRGGPEASDALRR